MEPNSKKKRKIAAAEAGKKRGRKSIWSEADVDLLKTKLREGENLTSLKQFFPEKTKEQISSKISKLKSGDQSLKIPNTSLRPSLKDGTVEINK